MQQKISWGIMVTVGILLVIIGFEGSLGKVLACILTPAEVQINKSIGVF